ncbi:hypothetical protein [Conyzicola sp.]|uniref:hypothetical protein n=1 Tax=Conyzicola sp. TaxID=1969404 RepID=UPI0039894813
MAVLVRLDIDVEFSVEFAGEVIDGTVTADGNVVDIRVSNPADLVAGRRGAIPVLRQAAAALAKRGIVLSLSGPDGVLASIGAVRAPVADRLVTGSPHIRVRSMPLLMRALRAKQRSDSPVFVPPTTLAPLAPTLERNRRRQVTTTHYTPGSGRPRLIFVLGSAPWDGKPPREFELLPTTTTIGSSDSADLRLDGIDAIQAEIRHDKNDEYVLFVNGDSAAFPVLDPDRGRGRILRTGARIDIGEWRLAYFREEFADHGRPFGGRLGGELSRQKPQPPRPRA